MDRAAHSHLWALAAGAASGILYLLSVDGSFFSLLIAYTPLFPLLLAGLALGARAGTVAALLGSFMAGAFGGLPILLVYALLYAVPSVFFSHASLTVIGEKRWYPIGGVLTGLSLYAAVILAIFIAISLQGTTGLEEMIPQVESDNPALLEQARELLIKAPFIVFALGAWIQLLMFYGVAVFANFMLSGWNRELRPNLKLFPFMPSILILAAMLVAGLVSFSDELPLQIAAKTAFMILLLPYFLMGIARMHAFAKHWPNRNLWLFVIYLLTVLVFWPIFWFIGAGLFEQARFLSNRHGGGTDA